MQLQHTTHGTGINRHYNLKGIMDRALQYDRHETATATYSTVQCAVQYPLSDYLGLDLNRGHRITYIQHSRQQYRVQHYYTTNIYQWLRWCFDPFMKHLSALEEAEVSQFPVSILTPE